MIEVIMRQKHRVELREIGDANAMLDKIIANAPATEDNFFLVPKVVE